MKNNPTTIPSKEDKEWKLPAGEELKLRDSIMNIHGHWAHYRLGFNAGRIFSCKKLLGWAKENNITKKKLFPLMKEIMGDRFNPPTNKN